MNSLAEIVKMSIRTAEQLIWVMDSWLVILLQVVLLTAALIFVYKLAKEWGIVR